MRQFFFFFFFNDTATTEIYTLSLHDALPIYRLIFPAATGMRCHALSLVEDLYRGQCRSNFDRFARSEEHTSELQSQSNLVCRLLLEKKKTKEQHSDSMRFSHTCIVRAGSVCS